MSCCGVDIGPLRWRLNLPLPGTPRLIITPCLETGEGEGAWEIFYPSSPPTSRWWCGVLERSLTNRSLLLHLYMQVMVFSIWNNYIMYVQYLKLLSQTHAKMAPTFLCDSNWFDSNGDYIRRCNKVLMLGPKIFSPPGLEADVIMNNIYVTLHSLLCLTRRDQFRPQLYCNLQQRFIVTIQCQLSISSSCHVWHQ